MGDARHQARLAVMFGEQPKQSTAMGQARIEPTDYGWSSASSKSRQRVFGDRVVKFSPGRWTVKHVLCPTGLPTRPRP